MPLMGWTMELNLPGSGIRVSAGHGAALLLRDEVRALASACVAEWTVAERVRAMLLASLTPGDQPRTSKSVVVLRDRRALDECVQCVAAALRSDEARELFNDVLRRFASAQEERNLLAHSIWAAHLPTPGDAFTMLDPTTIDDATVSMACANELERVDRRMTCRTHDPVNAGEVRRLLSVIRKRSSGPSQIQVLGCHDPESLRSLHERIAHATSAALAFLLWEQGRAINITRKWLNEALAPPGDTT